jgi:hypothetical protein
MASSQSITCPSCGAIIDIESAITHELEERHRVEVERRIREREATVRAETEAAMRASVQTDLEQLRRENEQRKRENTDLKKRELDLLEAQRQLTEQQQQFDLELKRRVLKEREAAEIDARRTAEQQFDLERRDLQKKLEDQQRLLEEARRKGAQGSQQTQGEVAELVLEEYLRDQFPHDAITEVPKGVRGVDCLHQVNLISGVRVGTIAYEVKNTKIFSKDFIVKLKDDLRACNADIGVIITETMPDGMTRFGLRDGVWICSMVEFKPLVHVLRELVLRVGEAHAAVEHRGDKMSLLYSYLTGTEFRQQFEAIVDGFVKMEEELNAERRAMEQIWKRRSKQIEKVISSAASMYGSIRGIAGNAIAPVQALELPQGDTLDAASTASEDA